MTTMTLHKTTAALLLVGLFVKSAGVVAVEATRGSFRFVTGSQSKGSYQVKTPYGTPGIRG